MSFLPANPLAVRTATFMAAVIAGIASPTFTQAAPARPAPRAAPAPHFAPRPMARPAPQMHTSRPATPQFRPSRPAQNFHAVNPHVQRVNPGAQHANPGAQHFNPGAQHFNPGAQHFNPGAQHFNPGQNVQHTSPNLPRVNPTGGPGLGAGGLNRGPGHQLAGPGHMNQGPGFKPAFPAVSMHNRFWPIQRGPKFMWFGGARHFFVPVGLLGVAIIGGSYWYPDGYVSIAGPACFGLTPDGCQLHWRTVDFEDGGGEPQCVQYCAQPPGPPPANAAPLPPPPALMQTGNCQLTIFADPNFGGLSAPSADNQPVLSQTGWQNEISSIQVQSGTWDFFSGENFGGESMRLTAGEYPALAPEWTKRIGSFMCIAPGAPGA